MELYLKMLRRGLFKSVFIPLLQACRVLYTGTVAGALMMVLLLVTFCSCLALHQTQQIHVPLFQVNALLGVLFDELHLLLMVEVLTLLI